ncbi:hypothetical protein ACG83_20250 [Frankia sp. R43]|uniref:TIGR02680 family protein n=1 Tax=Frankia sp. R43 TaxID=269536 RepID=UPI0006CA213C|nr:TIGR02680 family protein [Frankia sp. R43]KPM54301.1 hypothetical protein ACG83_20250 [Frankia sp. R43]
MQQTLALTEGTEDRFGPTPIRRHPYRWRLSRAGFVNVWHYYDNTFDLSGGRLILRGTNGSGKSRALEMLLPFLLDADRRNMGTGTAVRMEDLMTAGAGEQTNRLGYMWLELRRDVEADEDPASGYLTLGALVRFSASTKEAKVWYFTTALRVGHELSLLTADRKPRGRKELGQAVGEDRISDGPEPHRERVRAEVFGLAGGDAGKERFNGLMKLLHTLRSPDVGNRIEEGRLPQIVSDALPPLSEEALTDAGQQLDGLTSTRDEQKRLEAAHGQVVGFLDSYRRYLAGVLTRSLTGTRQRAANCLETEAEAVRKREIATGLDSELLETLERRQLLADQVSELAAALDALKESDRYRGAKELTELSATVSSLAETARAKLELAQLRREGEVELAGAANALLTDMSSAVDELSERIDQARDQLTRVRLTAHELPASIGLVRTPPERRSDLVRVRRDAPPVPTLRPAADVPRLVPPDLIGLRAAAGSLREAADLRAARATSRAADARRLSDDRAGVQRAVETADDAAVEAETAASRAEQEADERDREAVGLVERWRAWLGDPGTGDLLGDVDWSAQPTLGPLLLDRLVLCGTEADGPVDLSELDRAADDAAAGARDRLAGELHRLDADDTADRRAVELLVTERRQLEASRDDPPLEPFWVTAPRGAALWQCVDFAPGQSADEQAGIEAAMLASGLLTATIDARGQLTATSGQLLVSPIGPRAAVSVAAKLVPDPAGPIDPGVISALLGRIGLADPSAAMWVAPDGSWANGPLRGRHAVPAARHIGAAAREAHRVQRLREIGTELEELAAAAQARAEQRARVEERKKAIRGHLRSAPRSKPLSDARVRAASEERQATQAATKAARLRAEADRRAIALAESEKAHRAACAEFGLPVDADSLADLARAATVAAGTCVAVIGQVDVLTGLAERHQRAVGALAAAAEPRGWAEGDAELAWNEWHAGDTRIEALRRALGADPARVLEELKAIEAGQVAAKRELGAAEAAVGELRSTAATAAAQADNADQKVRDEQAALAEQVDAVRAQLGQPGVVASAFTAKPAEPFTDHTAGAVAADAAALLAGLRRSRIEENALIRAQQVFDREIAASYEVIVTRHSEVLLYELADADGRRPLVEAAADLARKCDQGREALTEREQRVFTEFILGEVGEELRGRLYQAEDLITAMNRSLRSIQTSHGIGVRLTWKLAADNDAAVSRIRQLVMTAASIRSQAQDAELLELLRERVAAEALAEPNAGYALFLRKALDYRTWHTVEVIITGPEPGQERRISRRAKLSQGETRFVSYVTLFAAVDAYLSGLDDTATALRLILLDDAFAKVDDPTIAELLGLLVRLDVDFAMTGHALWGCVPQVPALDIYEICRQDGGGPAATVHVRWDGRNRHFLHSA